jgi:hypothetical protein
VALDPDKIDQTWRGADLRVTYPGRHLGELPPVLSPFVRLEVGSARVTPHVAVDLSSYVHEKLVEQGLEGEFDDNRPRAVRCVHPLVTLLEKLDALHRRFPGERSAAAFVRHYEDAAQIIQAKARLPPLIGYANVRALAEEMLAQQQLAVVPVAEDPAFFPSAEPRWNSIRSAHAATDPMFWGTRIPIDEACETIRGWLVAELA